MSVTARILPKAAFITFSRENVILDGILDGINQIFKLPGGDKAINQPPNIQIKFYRNGVRQHPGSGNDYEVTESGGPGTGYDTFTINPPPISGEILLVDYIII